MHEVKTSLQAELKKMADREEELRTLRRCLLQVTEEAADQADQRDAEREMEGESDDVGDEERDGTDRDVMERKEAQLKKIQAMLDTTKVSWLIQRFYP